MAKVLSSAVLGVDAYLVEVEVDLAFRFPQFSTVGLPGFLNPPCLSKTEI